MKCPHCGKETSVKSSISFDGFHFQNLNGEVDYWREQFPAIDVVAEIKKAESWLHSNPKNIKSNYKRFLNNWLTKAQDRAPRSDNGQVTGQAPQSVRRNGGRNFLDEREARKQARYDAACKNSNRASGNGSHNPARDIYRPGTDAERNGVVEAENHGLSVLEAGKNR